MEFTPGGTGSTQVLYAVQGRLGRVRLNRPRAINALTLEMVESMHARLDEWQADDRIAAIAIDGAGDRGLCSGGDIRVIRQGIVDHSMDPVEYWAAEYRLNSRIASFPKPIVSIMDGVTMGGGVGVAGFATLRLATDRSRIAMPETAIGFFPDVGARYLLARAPGETGTHLALTGLPVNGADAVAVGLADAVVAHTAIPGLLDRLADNASVDTLPLPPAPDGELAVHRSWIDQCYRGDDPVAIITALREHPDPAAHAAAEVIATRCPLSVAVSLEGVRRAADLTLDEVLAQDLRLGARFAAEPDFVEGVRAVLVDRDTPRWQHAGLADVDSTLVKRFFDQSP